MKTIEIRTLGLPLESYTKFVALQGGLKTINETRLKRLIDNILTNGFISPIFIWQNQVVDGHQRLKAIERLMADGYNFSYEGNDVGDKIPYVVISAKDKQEAGKYILTYNSQYGQIVGLNEFLTDFDLKWDELNDKLCLKEDYLKFGKNTNALRQTWVMPPFSILDSRLASWRERRDQWRALMGNTTITRENALGDNLLAGINEGVSLFDPVLAELLFRWFNPAKGKILNLFAGDVEPNIVAAYKGYKLDGIELRQEQIDHTLAIAKSLSVDKKLNLICDDVLNQNNLLKDNSYDMLFSCPPYYDLEEYSEDERDFANLEDTDFDKLLEQVVKDGCAKLKNDRFAVFVVSEVRGPDGSYRGLVPKVVNWFTRAGLKYYNEVILVNSIGTLPFRVGRAWVNRKVGRMHQNILVFYKGNTKNIKEAFKEQQEQNFRDLGHIIMGDQHDE